jgi:formylglycine-generating enzyme required for sulfatase activity
MAWTRHKAIPLAALVATVTLTVIAWRLVAPHWANDRPDSPAVADPDASSPAGRTVHLPRATFLMGSDSEPERDRRPAHDVTVGPLWIDACEVTNRQFAEFVRQSGHVTTAEQRGWSLVWDEPEPDQQGTGGWRRREGVDWRHPFGPHSSNVGRERLPVVHVSWHDAVAYCRWHRGRLPTEAEWEYAARAGLRGKRFPWGDRERADDGTREPPYLANTRQHGRAADADGFDGLAPVGSFPPNRFGLYDMTGNAAEWCADRYAPDYYATSPDEDPRGPSEGAQRVVRGGSWLSPEAFRADHHVGARSHRPTETTTGHLGFRCVYDTPQADR